MHRAVDGLVGVEFADRCGRVEGGDLGVDVRGAVDALSTSRVSVLLSAFLRDLDTRKWEE